VQICGFRISEKAFNQRLDLVSLDEIGIGHLTRVVECAHRDRANTDWLGNGIDTAVSCFSPFPNENGVAGTVK